MINNSNLEYFQFMDANIHKNNGLREPQLFAYNSAYKHFITDQKETDAIIVLPTGVGKTGLMGILPFGISHGRVLIITPQLTIKDTVLNSLNPDNPQNFWLKRNIIEDYDNLPVVIDYNKDIQIADLSKANFVIMNIHKLQERLESSLLHNVSDDFFDMIIIDEAHHSPAETWQTVLDFFSKAKVIKVTGTPFRSDNLNIEGELIYKYKLSQAMANNYVKSLENIHYVPDELLLSLDKDESKLYTLNQIYDTLGKSEDWVSRSVAYSTSCSEKIVDESIALLEMKKAVSQLPHKIIAVACSIHHAEEIQELYQQKGLRTTIIHSNLEDNIKRANFSDITNHRIDVVIQVSMLGEGYDHPYLSIAAIFRPFRNPLPYAQFIGRILRYISSENKDLNPNDNIGQIISHKYLYMDDLWSFYKEQINECDIIKSLQEIDIDEIIDSADSENTEMRSYDVSIGSATELGNGKTIGEMYLDTELFKQAEEQAEKDNTKAEELAKLLNTSLDEALDIIKREKFKKDNKYKRPELLAQKLKHNIDNLVREQYVPDLLTKYDIDHQSTSLKNLPLLRAREYSWILNKNLTNNGMLAIYFNTHLKNKIQKPRKNWDNNDLNIAFEYLTSDLYPFVEKAIASFKKLM